MSISETRQDVNFVLNLFYMSSVFFADHPLVSIFFSEPGILLFGVLMVLFGITLTLLFVIRKNVEFLQWFSVSLILLFFVLLVIVSLDLFGGSGSVSTFDSFGAISTLFSTHRWLLIQAPILLLGTSSLMVLVYGKELLSSHAKEYFFIVRSSVILSFLTILLIGFESLI